MVMTIGETAGTFKSVVRPLKLNEVSHNLRDFFFGTENDVLRFDLPQDLTLIIGSHYNGETLFVSETKDSMILSAFGNEHMLGEASCFLWKPRGDPQSNVLDVDDDAQFICVPKDQLSIFKEGDEIVYTLVKETDTEERHIKINHVS
jgi:hypothetical protein